MSIYIQYFYYKSERARALERVYTVYIIVVHSPKSKTSLFCIIYTFLYFIRILRVCDIPTEANDTARRTTGSGCCAAYGIFFLDYHFLQNIHIDFNKKKWSFLTML